MKNRNLKMTASANIKCTTAFAAYWTTMEVKGNLLAVRFRFPMKFGLLRAADWAEKETAEIADWWAGPYGADVMKTAEMRNRLRMMMPMQSGHRKALHRNRMTQLTIGGGSVQIEMVMNGGENRMDDAARMDDAMDDMVKWMREKAYEMQMQ